MSAQVLSQVISGKFVFGVRPRISLRKIYVFWFILIASLLVFYIFQINEITKSGFLIYKQEREMAAISQQSKDLGAGLFTGSSLVNLENILYGSYYEKVDKVYYIQIIDDGMAIKHEKLAD